MKKLFIRNDKVYNRGDIEVIPLNTLSKIESTKYDNMDVFHNHNRSTATFGAKGTAEEFWNELSRSSKTLA